MSSSVFFFSLCWRVFQFSSSSSSRTPFLRCSSVLFRGRSKSSSSNKAKNVHQNGSAMINSISLYLLEETDLLGRPSPEHCLGTTGLGFCGECEEVVFRLLQDISGGEVATVHTLEPLYSSIVSSPRTIYMRKDSTGLPGHKEWKPNQTEQRSWSRAKGLEST